MEQSEVLQNFQQIMNAADGLQPEDFADAVECIREMTLEDLQFCYIADQSSGASLNSENHLLRGLITEMLQEAGVDLDALTTDSIYEASHCEIPGLSRDFTVVAPDKTIRAREDVFFEHTEIDNLTFPEISGFYERKIQSNSRTSKKNPKESSKAKPLPCTVTGACFTDRVMMPMFLSSLIVKLFKDDLEREPLRLKRWANNPKREYAASALARDETAESQPISEKSFRTTVEIWNQLFNQLETLSQQKYKTSLLCLRDFFFKSLEAQELILTAPELVLDATQRQERLNKKVQQKEQDLTKASSR